MKSKKTEVMREEFRTRTLLKEGLENIKQKEHIDSPEHTKELENGYQAERQADQSLFLTEVISLENLGKEERKHSMQEAAAILRAGELVAFPTETVYGLGADAMNEDAAQKIYAAKGRPSDNPLIIHISRMEQVDEVAEGVTDKTRQMLSAFWPGPLTVILNKKPCVPDGTTGGLKTVAIRMPSHPIARELIEESGRLIAAPSANASGRPSPTLARHVYEDMKGRIPLILDGGAVGIGIESTIVDMTGNIPVILRPGYITKTMLEEILGAVQVDPAVSGRMMRKDIVAKAPGMKYRHYAPKGKMTLVEGSEEAVTEKINRLVWEKIRQGYKVGVIGTDETIDRYYVGYRKSIGARNCPDIVAANLYRVLREFDAFDAEYIYSESFFASGLGNAIMNRMLKAAGYHLLTL